MNEAQVDIVIPFHEGDAFAEETLRCLVAQTHQSWKAWIVDDGSSERSLGRLREIAANLADPRINLVAQSQQGASVARNHGVMLGRAAWVAFLDIDDIWAPDKLERQLALAAARAVVVAVYCDYFILAEGSLSPGAVPPELQGLIAPALVRQGNRVSGSASAVLVRRSALEKAGPFDVSLRLGEDWDLWIRLGALGEFAFVPAPLVQIRQRAGSVQNVHRHGSTYAAKTRELLAHVQIVRRHAPTILPLGFNDTELIERLRRDARRLAKQRLTWGEVGRLRETLRTGGEPGNSAAAALSPWNLLPCFPWIFMRTLTSACTPAREVDNP